MSGFVSFHVDGYELRRALLRVRPAATLDAPMVTVTVKPLLVMLTCGDGTWSIETRCNAESVRLGSFAVPVKHALQALGSMTSRRRSRKVTVIFEGGDVDEARVSSAFAVHGLAAFEAAQHVPVDGLEMIGAGGDEAIVDAGHLVEVLRAASLDQGRGALRGVQVRDTALYATDGYRLHAIQDIPSMGAGDEPLVIPAAAVAAALAQGTSAEVSVRFYGGWVAVTRDVTTSTTRLASEQYPYVERLIPDLTPTTFTVAHSDLADAMTELAYLTDRAHPLRIEHAPELTCLRLIGRDPNIGTAVVDIPAKHDGAFVAESWGAHLPFLRDAIRDFGVDVQIGVTGSGKPMVITEPSSGEEPRRLRLVMPVRL